MKHTDVIDWKLASINGGAGEQMPEEMKAYLAQNPELEAELDFIERFWLTDVAPMEMPSAQMDANFYQMLSRAQASQPVDFAVTQEQERSGFWQSLVQWWQAPQPIAQFAILGLVFVIGFNMNQAPPAQTNDGLSSLQQEVSSLNTMLAISLLDKSSASERLSGVAYSRSSDISNPILQEKLISLIQGDKSTSVRLAVINRLAELSSIAAYSDALLTLTASENNVLVQLALVRLLLNNGSLSVQEQLKDLLKNKDLKPEVRDVLQANASRSFT